jgi:ABC-2 type transport system ATP-binding protein
MAAALACSGLVKRFGTVTALDGPDLEVAPGEVHGFLGPNGAGKTVTMRILLGLLRHDGGTVSVLGRDPWTDAVALHRRMAYVPGDTNLWPNLTGGEILDLLAGLRGGVDRARRDLLVERFDLDLRRKARSYSKGNRQKVALVAALASDAELLVLDEPTSGLDPLMEAVFRDQVLEARAAGRAILLSSHVLGEVEKLCDRVTIIRRGRTVQTGSLGELRHLTRTTITAATTEPADVLSDHAGVHDLRHEDGQVSFAVDSDQLDDVVRHLAGLGVRSLTSNPPTLEELFLRHYGDELADAGVDEPDRP